jgi:3-dehydroquinate synthase
VRSGLTEPSCLDDLRQALARYDLPIRCGYTAKELAQAALHDKKRAGGTISLVIPKETGRAEILDLPVAQLEGFIAEGLEEQSWT